MTTNAIQSNSNAIAQIGQLLNIDLTKEIRLTRRGEFRKRDALRCIQALAHRYQIDLRAVATSRN